MQIFAMYFVLLLDKTRRLNIRLIRIVILQHQSVIINYNM